MTTLNWATTPLQLRSATFQTLHFRQDSKICSGILAAGQGWTPKMIPHQKVKRERLNTKNTGSSSSSTLLAAIDCLGHLFKTTKLFHRKIIEACLKKSKQISVPYAALQERQGCKCKPLSASNKNNKDNGRPCGSKCLYNGIWPLLICEKGQKH